VTAGRDPRVRNDPVVLVVVHCPDCRACRAEWTENAAPELSLMPEGVRVVRELHAACQRRYSSRWYIVRRLDRILAGAGADHASIRCATCRAHGVWGMRPPLEMTTRDARGLLDSLAYLGLRVPTPRSEQLAGDLAQALEDLGPARPIPWGWVP
jgi:hypothetical protein